MPFAPGTVTFLDNGGAIGIRRPRLAVSSFEWAGALSSGGAQTVTVQFRNIHTWDTATILRWTLTIQHA